MPDNCGCRAYRRVDLQGTYLTSRIPSIRCDACWVKKARGPWAREGSGYDGVRNLIRTEQVARSRIHRPLTGAMHSQVHSHSLSPWHGRLEHSAGQVLQLARRCVWPPASPSVVRHATGSFRCSRARLED